MHIFPKGSFIGTEMQTALSRIRTLVTVSISYDGDHLYHKHLLNIKCVCVTGVEWLIKFLYFILYYFIRFIDVHSLQSW